MANSDERNAGPGDAGGGDGDDEVEETSEESFPASDAPSWTGVTGAHASRMPASADSAPEIVNNVAEKRFEMRFPEGIAELQYRLRGPSTIVLAHTEVPPQLQNRGIAGKLARAALEHARDRQLAVVVICPFVAAFLKRHPEYQSLVTEL